jgi:hypothetical protein
MRVEWAALAASQVQENGGARGFRGDTEADRTAAGVLLTGSKLCDSEGFIIVIVEKAASEGSPAVPPVREAAR